MHLCLLSTEENQAFWLRWFHLWAGPIIDKRGQQTDVSWRESVVVVGREMVLAEEAAASRFSFDVSQDWTQHCLRNTGHDHFWSDGAFQEAASAALLSGTVGESTALKAGRLASDPYFCTGSLRRLLTFLGHVSSSTF